MIKSFRCKETARLFARKGLRRFPPSIRRAAARKLLILDAAELLDDPRIPPANRLGKLKGKRMGQYSIRVNDRWRICFQWSRGDAYNVEIADYH